MERLPLWNRSSRLLEDEEGVDDAGFHQEPQEIPPPFLAWTSHGVVGPVLVEQVHSAHVLVVGQNWLWNLLGFLRPWGQ